MKGFYDDQTGKLWFVGIFATPIVLGLLAASLPDHPSQPSLPPISSGPVGVAPKPQKSSDTPDLPSV